MRVYCVTLFEEVFTPFLKASLLGRAQASSALQVHTVPLREYGLGKRKQVDDYPYGGGPGMVLRPEPLFRAVRAVEAKEGRKARTVLFTPAGEVLHQQMLQAFAHEPLIILLCGHYEGVDERVHRYLATDRVSLGNFVTSSGESVAMVFLDGLARLLPGVLSEEALSEESFNEESLEYPQYTRPRQFEGHAVPSPLLSGHHQKIAVWRKEQAQRRTAQYRPDLLAKNISQGGPL